METSRNVLVENAVEKAVNAIEQLTLKNKIDLFTRIRKKGKPYLEIIKFCGDVSEDKDFQTNFNWFYKVRKNQEWRNQFYKFFQELRLEKRNPLTFRDIFDKVRGFDDSRQYSFPTKMLHTLDDTQPIIDSKVLEFLNIRKPQGKDLDKFYEHYDMYHEIMDRLLNKVEIKKILDEFDEKLPEFSTISRMKKLDFILWKFKE